MKAILKTADATDDEGPTGSSLNGMKGNREGDLLGDNGWHGRVLVRC